MRLSASQRGLCRQHDEQREKAPPHDHFHFLHAHALIPRARTVIGGPVFFNELAPPLRQKVWRGADVCHT